MSDLEKNDIKAFQNPTGYWEYKGTFSVELVPNADKSIAPHASVIDGDTVTVSNGRVRQSMGGIQLYSNKEEPFFWGYKYVKVIRNEHGGLLWVNYNYS